MSSYYCVKHAAVDALRSAMKFVLDHPVPGEERENWVINGHVAHSTPSLDAVVLIRHIRS